MSPDPLRTRREAAAVAAIVVLAFAALTYDAASPWQGHGDWNGALWSLFARNFLRYGYRALHFGHAYFAGPMPDHVGYYTHHSVVITLILTELYRVFGIHEAVARTAVSAVTVATAVLLYRLTNALFTARTALVATLVFALCPLTLFFGRMYNHEVFALFWIVACVAAYRRWLASHARRDLAGVGTTTFLATMTAWPGYYLWPALIVHHRLAVGRNAEHRRLQRVLAACTLVAFAVYLAHGYWLRGTTLFVEIVEACRKGWFSDRLDWGEAFTFRTFVETELQRSVVYFTWPVVALAVVGFGSVVRSTLQRRGMALAHGVLLLFLGLGASHVLLFKQSAMGHDYYIYYLLPAVAVAAGIGATRLATPGSLRPVRVTALVALALAFVVATARTTRELHATAWPERRFYVQLGTWLHDHTDFRDRVLANVTLEGPFVSFYADRDVVEGIDSLPKLRQARTASSVLVMRVGRTPHLERVIRRHYAVETIRSNGEPVDVVRLSSGSVRAY
jgi:dolichyl-phosphate-mannose-protein mannosyltransferase